METLSVKLASLLFSVSLLAGLPAMAATAPGPSSALKVVARVSGPDGGWDYATFDAARHKVYVTRRTTVMALDIDSGKVDAHFSEGGRLHAAVPVPGTNLIVTTDSGDATAKVISAADGHLIVAIPTPKDTDGAVYDPGSGLVLVVCGDGGAVALIDAKAGKSVGVIDVGTPLEFADIDGEGHAFVNENEKNAVARLDLAALKVTATWPLPGCQRPTGLAYGEGQVISACGNGVADILDAATGKPLASLTIGKGPDAVIFDPKSRIAYVPSGATGTLAVIPLSGPVKDTIVATVQTEVGARTGTVDPSSGRLYLPSAQFSPPATAGARPQAKPGTFEMLVVGAN
jgi:DNA-binding beta-propeller fold protein YncE